VDALTQSSDEGRGVAAICLGEVRSNLWSGDFRMGKPVVVKLQPQPAVTLRLGANPLKWNIPVSGGEENECYSLSSGERKGKSPNLCASH